MDDIAAAIEPHLPALRRYAWALLRDRDAADDLVQDCLERAVARWRSRRDDSNVRAWLFTIEHNLFIDAVRHRRRRGVPVDVDELDGRDLPAGDPDARLHLHDVLTQLDTLPDEQKAVLLLVAVEDLTYEETARVLGVPIGTVMSRLSRARERLRRGLDAAPGPMLRRVK